MIAITENIAHMVSPGYPNESKRYHRETADSYSLIYQESPSLNKFSKENWAEHINVVAKKKVLHYKYNI